MVETNYEASLRSVLLERRRQLAHDMARSDQPPTASEIAELASVHAAISAVEAVLAEAQKTDGLLNYYRDQVQGQD